MGHNGLFPLVSVREGLVFTGFWWEGLVSAGFGSFQVVSAGFGSFRFLVITIRSSSQRNCLVLIYSTPNTLCYTLSFNVSMLLLRAAWKTLETAAIFQNVRRAVNKLSFPNNRNSYGRRSSWRILVIGSECLTKDTAISEKCQQNVSKIAQCHEYRLPSAAINLCFPLLEKEIK